MAIPECATVQIKDGYDGRGRRHALDQVVLVVQVGLGRLAQHWTVKQNVNRVV